MGKDSAEYKVPEGGSLGLLALGDIGLVKWRKKRGAMKLKKKSTNKKKKNG
jgi:hypothetical protein